MFVNGKSSMFKKILNINILPSWLILFIDLFLVITVSFANFVLLKLIANTSSNSLLILYLVVNFIIYFISFIIFSTFNGVIRYSSHKDLIKIINAVFFSFLIIVLLNVFYQYFYNTHIVSTLFLFVNNLLILLVLITFRIFVKYFFQIINQNKNSNLEKSKITIIGVSSLNISLVELLSLSSSNFKLVAFFDLNRSLNGKKIAGISIIADGDSIINHLRDNDISNIIMSKNYFSEKEENELFDYCIQNNVKIYKPELLQKPKNNVSNSSLQEYQLEELLFRKSIEIENPNIHKQFHNKVVLVTGGAGSIGSELAKQIALFHPSKLIILDQAETPIHEIELFFNKNLPDYNCVFELVDVTKYDELEHVFALHRPEIIFHAAAYKHVPILEKNYKQAVKVNVFGTQNCLELASKYNAKKFIFVSTDKAVNPTNIMGASKRIAELMAQSLYINQNNTNKLEIMITRFGNVLGSNGSVVHLFKQQIADGGPITVTHPEVTRFFMTIPEACKLVIEAAAIGNGGNIYVFDMGKSIKIVDLAQKMIRLAGKIPNKDIEIEFSGLRPGEKLYEEVLTECSETLPTHNPKIVIAKETSDLVHSFEDINNFLKNFNNMDREEVVTVLKKLVPEFIMNSENS